MRTAFTHSPASLQLLPANRVIAQLAPAAPPRTHSSYHRFTYPHAAVGVVNDGRRRRLLFVNDGNNPEDGPSVGCTLPQGCTSLPVTITFNVTAWNLPANTVLVHSVAAAGQQGVFMGEIYGIYPFGQGMITITAQPFSVNVLTAPVGIQARSQRAASEQEHALSLRASVPCCVCDRIPAARCRSSERLSPFFSAWWCGRPHGVTIHLHTIRVSAVGAAHPSRPRHLHPSRRQPALDCGAARGATARLHFHIGDARRDERRPAQVHPAAAGGGGAYGHPRDHGGRAADRGYGAQHGHGHGYGYGRTQGRTDGKISRSNELLLFTAFSPFLAHSRTKPRNPQTLLVLGVDPTNQAAASWTQSVTSWQQALNFAVHAPLGQITSPNNNILCVVSLLLPFLACLIARC